MIKTLYSFLITEASCQEGGLKRADPKQLRAIFDSFATVNKNGEKYITNEDFVRKFLGVFDKDDFKKESVDIIAGIVDMDKDGFISFSEFQAFEELLCVPDALYRTAFQLFDTNGNGRVAFKDFADVMQKTALHEKMPFNMDSTFVHLYFGKDKKRLVTYPEFSQFLHDFHEEYGVEAFKQCDTDGTGFISAHDFREIMLSVRNHLLTNDLRNRVINISGYPQGENKISFPHYMAFNSLLYNMELIKRVYLNASNGRRTQEVTKEQFLHSAQMMSQITPLEVDILFTLCDRMHHTNGQIEYKHLISMTPEHYFKQVKRRLAKIQAVSSPDQRGFLMQVLETVYRFTLASIGGAVGAAVVYPIDLVKTRMQSQRIGPSGEMMYKNSLDCFRKVLSQEGALGLYRGLTPQMVGIAPEKAIKLTVNDVVRDKLTDKNGNIELSGEIISGMAAGCCQVICTNPLEIVKIRLQVAGESKGGSKIGALAVVRELGLRGLYKGARACMLRDMTFSAIYFPSYARVKAKLADDKGYNHPLSLLAAGAIAGIPASSLVTPLDVIKTRLQESAYRYWACGVRAEFCGFGNSLKGKDPPDFEILVWLNAPSTKPQLQKHWEWFRGLLREGSYLGFNYRQVVAKSGQTVYSGFIDAIRKIYTEEGFRAFWKGTMTRVCRSSPQFGVTLGTYELLQRLLYIDFGGSRPAGSEHPGLKDDSKMPHHIGGYEVALPVLSGLDTKFGISLPRFSYPKP